MYEHRERACIVPTTHAQIVEDQMQGQHVTQGLLEIKTDATSQVKEVAFALFSQQFVKSHQRDRTVGTKVFRK